MPPREQILLIEHTPRKKKMTPLIGQMPCFYNCNEKHVKVHAQWRHYGCANGAPHRGQWVEGAHSSPKLLTDCTGHHNTIIIGKLPLFINRAIINVFLKIIDTLQKSDLWSLDFTQKCSQNNAGNAISETLNSNIFWRRILSTCHHSVGP